MMTWTLAILFGAAVILFILSFLKKDTIKVEQQMEQLTSTFGDEISQIQMKIRNLEIDAEIMAQEAGLLTGSSEQRLLLHEVLDLYKRGYSMDSIATKKNQTTDEVVRMLTPYMKTKDERGKVANDI